MVMVGALVRSFVRNGVQSGKQLARSSQCRLHSQRNMHSNNLQSRLVESTLSRHATLLSVGTNNRNVLSAASLHTGTVHNNGHRDNSTGLNPSSEYLSDTTAGILVSPPDSSHEVASSFEPLVSLSDPLVVESAAVSLRELGLGGYTPIGLTQQLLNACVEQVGLPWWGAIMCGTALLRLIVFPFLMKGQVNGAKLNAIKPQMEVMQKKMKEAQNFKDPQKLRASQQELTALYTKHDCNPLKSLIGVAVQMPLFISFFFAIRGMSTIPLESMKTGGALWFTDISAGDPYFVLPIITAATMFVVLETADKPPTGDPKQMKMVQWLGRGMTILMVPITYSFPSGVFVYWITSNALTLVQASLLRIPVFRSFYNLPPRVVTVTPVAKNGERVHRGGLMGWIDELKVGVSAGQAVKVAELEEKAAMNQAARELTDKTLKERVQHNEDLFKVAKRIADRQLAERAEKKKLRTTSQS